MSVADWRQNRQNRSGNLAQASRTSTLLSRGLSPQRTVFRDMLKIKVYTAGNCCYCHMAKDLLRRKGAPFEEFDVTGCTDKRADLCQKAGGRNTVPQIWIGDVHVGGCDDLHALDRSGKLDALLAN
jgi:glutaredoxin 3